MRSLLLAPAILLGLVSFPALSWCQDEPPEDKIRPSGTVTFDLSTRSFGAKPLPFDVPFQLRGKVAPQTDAIVAWYGLRATENGSDYIGAELGCAVWTREPPRDSSRAEESEFALDFLVHPLSADKEYLFVFTLYEPVDSRPLPIQTGDRTCGFYEQLKRAGPVRFRTTDSLSIRGSTRTEYTQRFDTDLGFVTSGGAVYTGLASSVHFYLWPINKSADLADFGFTESLRRRVSLMAGLAVTKLGAEKDVDHLMGIGSPMLGVGVRAPFYWQGFEPRFLPGWLVRPMRLNAGVIWFKQDDPNPLVDETSAKIDVFASISYDFDIRSILGPFISLLPE